MKNIKFSTKCDKCDCTFGFNKKDIKKEKQNRGYNFDIIEKCLKKGHSRCFLENTNPIVEITYTKDIYECEVSFVKCPICDKEIELSSKTLRFVRKKEESRIDYDYFDMMNKYTD